MTENSYNPFNKDADPDGLFNICTGESCKKSAHVFFFFLNVESIGITSKFYTGMHRKSPSI